MVNGRTSLAIYIGAWVTVLACIIGSVIVAITESETPTILMVAMTSAFGILAGSHIMPPISRDATRRAIDRTDAERAERRSG